MLEDGEYAANPSTITVPQVAGEDCRGAGGQAIRLERMRTTAASLMPEGARGAPRPPRAKPQGSNTHVPGSVDLSMETLNLIKRARINSPMIFRSLPLSTASDRSVKRQSR
jgi:hypothetical protein